ncbi:hypothetical protein BH11PSE12_BH11PSE12_00750 [soil metagenome]
MINPVSWIRSSSVRIIKWPAGFEFRNSGLLRVPVAQALHGGESDCRNRTLQQMFLMINLGERAGSGLPKICAAWEAAGHSLSIVESFEPYDQTTLVMTWIALATELVEEPSGKTSGKMSGKILDLIRENSFITIPELAIAIGVTERSIERNINTLQLKKLLSRIGPKNGGHWKVIE